MKNLLKYLLTVTCFGLFPLSVISQLVLPPASVVLHYKDENRRIQSHSIQQVTPLGNGDTLFLSFQTIVDTALLWGFLKEFKPVTGFPLGNWLTKKNSGTWTSRTADSTLLSWNFTTNLYQSWPIYQDSIHSLICQFVGMDTINHFSTTLPIWKYKLISSGSKFDSLNNKEIWLSDMGVVRCPDFRAYPYQYADLILAGYASPSLNKGLRFSQETYAPHGPGDTVVIQKRDLNNYIPSSDRLNVIFIYQLVAPLSATSFTQKWLVKTTYYKYINNAFVLININENDTVILDIMSNFAGGLVSWENPHVLHLFDELPFFSNPDTYFMRTFAKTFSSSGTKYNSKMINSSLQSGFGYSYFKSDWGFQYSYYERKSAHSPIPFIVECIYRTIGSRRAGSLPSLPVDTPIVVVDTPLVAVPSHFMSYPNPATSVLNFDDNEMIGRTANIRIYNNMGKIVKNEFHSFPIQLDVIDLSPGLYFICISDIEGYEKFTRFVKINP